MMNDTIQMLADSTATAIYPAHGPSAWMIVAIAELAVIIVLLLFCSKSDTSRSNIKKQVLAEGDVDFGNLVNSSFNAESLYRRLVVACHPDRFEPNEAKVAVANELTTRITNSKHDLAALNALREEARAKLNINL